MSPSRAWTSSCTATGLVALVVFWGLSWRFCWLLANFLFVTPIHRSSLFTRCDVHLPCSHPCYHPCLLQRANNHHPIIYDATPFRPIPISSVPPPGHYIAAVTAPILRVVTQPPKINVCLHPQEHIQTRRAVISRSSSGSIDDKHGGSTFPTLPHVSLPIPTSPSPLDTPSCYPTTL